MNKPQQYRTAITGDTVEAMQYTDSPGNATAIINWADEHGAMVAYFCENDEHCRQQDHKLRTISPPNWFDVAINEWLILLPDKTFQRCTPETFSEAFTETTINTNTIIQETHMAYELTEYDVLRMDVDGMRDQAEEYRRGLRVLEVQTHTINDTRIVEQAQMLGKSMDEVTQYAGSAVLLLNRALTLLSDTVETLTELGDVLAVAEIPVPDAPK